MSDNPLTHLADFGQSVWYDNIARKMLAPDGELPRLIREDGVVGVTSNPTIFEKAITEGDAYDDQIREMVRAGEDAQSVLRALTTDDVRSACDILADVYRDTNGKDGYVSIEVSPLLADDTAATCEEAEQLWGIVDRPNVMVKIPATIEGLPAITATIAKGINVNVTLVFGLERYDRVMEAYFAGLEQYDGDLSRIHSVGSFFVSRVDTEVDRRLESTGRADLQGKAAIANARLAYQRYLALHSGPRWEALAARGANKQRPLWASASTKNPEYSDTMYVDALIGPNTIETLPPVTVDAFRDHGKLPPPGASPLTEGIDESRRLFDELESVGIHYDDVIDTLEREGVEKFATSFRNLEESVTGKVEALRAEEVGAK
jgi:transaldolase